MTSITKHTKSLKYYVYTVVGIHVAGLTAFFPMFVLSIVGTLGTAVMLWLYIDLMYEIEKSNRNNLIRLIETSTNEYTKELLIEQLWYADMHSLGSDPLHEYRL